MNKSALSLEQMIAWKRQMDSSASLPVFQDPLTGKQYAPKSVTEYAAGFFTKLKNGQIFESKNTPAVGVRSINGNKLAAETNQLVYQARVLCDTTLIAETEAALQAAPFASVAPAYFKNGEVNFTQNAELLRTTGTDIHNAKASTGNDADFKDVAPFNLRGGVAFQSIFSLAGDATQYHAYKLEWRAIEFVPVENA